MKNVMKRGPRNYREVIRGRLKAAWIKVIMEELMALEHNGV